MNGDGVGNTVEENSSVFPLTESASCRQQVCTAAVKFCSDKILQGWLVGVEFNAPLDTI